MVSLSEFLSDFNYYFFIISVMIIRSYSERDGYFISRELKKLQKRALLMYIIKYIIYAAILLSLLTLIIENNLYLLLTWLIR